MPLPTAPPRTQSPRVIAIPAVDLRQGRCVQLIGGSYDHQRLRFDDPLDVVRGWQALGFQLLHLMDVDAATGRGTNAELVHEILSHGGVDLHVGGGVRSGDVIESLLGDGAQRVLLGPRAVEDPAWLAGTCNPFPGTLIVTLDVRGRRVVSRGRERTLAMNVLDLVEELDDLPLGGVMVTALDREGQLAGTDLPLMEDVAETSRHPVFVSGGITTMNELRILADAGVHGAILGRALYACTLDARSVAEEFCA